MKASPLFTLIFITSSLVEIAISSDVLQRNQLRDAGHAPSRTVLTKRKKGGGGGGDTDGDFGSGGDSSSGDGDAPECTPTTIVKPDPEHHNTLGYGGHELKGPGDYESIEGGYTKNGTGSSPSWHNETGKWIWEEWDWNYSFNDTGFYFGGADVPYTSGKSSPSGVVPSLVNIDYGDRFIISRPNDNYLEDMYDCQMAEQAYIYRYPKKFNFIEGDYDIDFGGYKNTTIPTAVLCCCDPERVCGCDYPGDPDFIQALGKTQVQWDRRGNSFIYNNTQACYFNLNGTQTLLINGTLDNGSTKANSSIPEAQVTQTRECPSAANSLDMDQAIFWVHLMFGVSGIWFVMSSFAV